MGYASHVAVKSLDNAVTTTTRDKLTLGLALYYAQLGLNFAWTPLFFGAHRVRHYYITSCSLQDPDPSCRPDSRWSTAPP